LALRCAFRERTLAQPSAVVCYAASTLGSPRNGDAALINLPDTSTVIDQLRAAAEAMNRGAPEPFLSLFAEDAEWRPIARPPLVEAHTLLTRA